MGPRYGGLQLKWIILSNNFFSLSSCAKPCLKFQIVLQGKVLRSEVKNMVKRFTDNGKAYFEFITSPGAEPTNNIAEQAIRFVVIDRFEAKSLMVNENRECAIAICGLAKLAIFTTNAHTKNECLLNQKTVIRSTEPPIFYRCC